MSYDDEDGTLTADPWTLVLMVGFLVVTWRLGALRGLARGTWLLVFAGAVTISINWGVYILAVLTGHVAEAAVGVLTVAYQRVPFIALTLAVSFASYGVVKKLTPLKPQISLAAETFTVALRHRLPGLRRRDAWGHCLDPMAIRGAGAVRADDGASAAALRCRRPPPAGRDDGR